MRIHHLLQAEKKPNATTLARALEVCSKTIHRDLEFMRDRLGLPLEYDSKANGYHYTGPVTEYPALQITEGELFALLIAEKAIQQYRGTPFEVPLSQTFQKIVSALPDEFSLNLAEWDRSISFRTSAVPRLPVEVFDQLARATAKRKGLKLHYRKPGASKAEVRTVDPYHLANINGEWFLFAHDHLRNDLRTFVPARIEQVEETGSTFERPDNFSLAKHLEGSFGIRTGGTPHKVVIQFSAQVATYVREKQWHASQQLRNLNEGCVELTLRLNELDEVRRWILSWAGEARAIAPKELIDAIRLSATQILKS